MTRSTAAAPRAHRPAPAHAATSERRLRTSMAVVALVLAAEVAGGLAAGSLALLGDAAHILTDVGTLGLAWYGVRRSHRPASASHTFGHHRTGILVAVVNGVLLLAVATALLIAGLERLRNPVTVSAGPVLLVAAFALLANGGVATLLARDEHGDLGVRSALLHVLGDVLASAGVMVSALVILATGWQRADAVVSLAIAALLAAGAVVILREATHILSESAPPGLDMDALRRAMVSVEGVHDVHDLHVWSLDRRHAALSAHVTVDDRPLGEVTHLLRVLENELCMHFGIEHATLQPECPSCVEDPQLFCDIDERHALVHAEVVSAPPR